MHSFLPFRDGAVPALMLVALLWSGCTTDRPDAASPAPGETSPGEVASGTLAVREPWARAAPAGGTSAVYFDLVNGQAEPDTLRAITGSGAARIEIHESYDDGGLRGMRPVTGVPVPAGGTTSLAPGGYHVMLIELARPLQPGDTLALDLVFARAGVRPLQVPVRGLDGLNGFPQ